MANTVLITKLEEGARNAVFHIYLKSDGVDGDLADCVVVDPAIDLTPVMARTPTLTIMEMWHELVGFQLHFDFGGVVNTPIWAVSANSNNHICFDKFGGLKDRSSSLDGNGKLLITTVGFTTTACEGSLVIKLRKD